MIPNATEKGSANEAAAKGVRFPRHDLPYQLQSRMMKRSSLKQYINALPICRHLTSQLYPYKASTEPYLTKSKAQPVKQDGCTPTRPC